MIVYRICLEKWSKKLTASGFPARWNPKGRFVLYTVGARALACLENVVHRSGGGHNRDFKLMITEIPEDPEITEIDVKKLPKNWTDFEANSACQKMGDQWVDDNES